VGAVRKALNNTSQTNSGLVIQLYSIQKECTREYVKVISHVE